MFFAFRDRERFLHHVVLVSELARIFACLAVRNCPILAPHLLAICSRTHATYDYTQTQPEREPVTYLTRRPGHSGNPGTPGIDFFFFFRRIDSLTNRLA